MMELEAAKGPLGETSGGTSARDSFEKSRVQAPQLQPHIY